MAHGLQIVSSNLPTSLELIDSFGLYFQNGNVNDLAQRLHDATTLDWQAKSEEALRLVRRFDLPSIAVQWEQLL